MSIQVQDVSKRYGQQLALDQVSFDIPTGQVVGFLGPNGAGKSTMMKIITCYIDPTEGQVTVNGMSTEKDTLEVKKSVGYLPEHNPLYPEMYVREYLRFVGGMYGIKKVKQRADDMIDHVGLGIEAHKRIGQLSKGYRQRVGLAQAMIHDPAVLILDEPTSGLDPNQLVDIRNLIRSLGADKTVMLSTHIMQEVEAICDRVLIIDRGHLVTDNPIETLRSGELSKGYVIELEVDGALDAEVLRLPGVSRVEAVGDRRWLISVGSADDLRGQLSAKVQESGVSVLGLSRKEQSLEEVFKQLTGKKD